MHIDTSVKLHKKGNTGIAYKIIGSGNHKGMVLGSSLKRDLIKNLLVSKDYARVYAICIFYLIKDNLDLFDTLIICEDENITHVKKYLLILFEDYPEYKTKEVLSLIELRKITGDKRIRSYADGMANSYRRRGLKCLVRQQEGVKLNPLKIDFKSIKKFWYLIDKK